MLKTAVLVSGGGTNLQAILDKIENGSLKNVEICCVISNNKGAYALERAKKAGVKAIALSPKSFETRAEYTDELIRILKEMGTELVVLAGFLVVIEQKMVDAFPNRIINVHPSLIPSFCGTGFYGLKVHEEALKRGVRVTGATVHFVDGGTDTGPIILQKAVEVDPSDTPKSLQQRVMEQAEWQILPEAIGLIARGAVRVEGRKVIIDA